MWEEFIAVCQSFRSSRFSLGQKRGKRNKSWMINEWPTCLVKDFPRYFTDGCSWRCPGSLTNKTKQKKEVGPGAKSGIDNLSAADVDLLTTFLVGSLCRDPIDVAPPIKPVNFRSDLTLILLQLWALSGRVKLVDSANDKRSFISAYVMNRSAVIVGGSASPRRNDSAPYFGVRVFHSTTFTPSAEWGVKPLTASAPTNPINLLLGAAKNPESVVLSI